MAFPGMVPDAGGFSASVTVTVFVLMLCCVTVCFHMGVSESVCGQGCAPQFGRPWPFGIWNQVSL